MATRFERTVVVGSSGGIGAAISIALAEAGTAVHALVIVATGLLHAEGIAPEKSYRQYSSASFNRYFAINATGPGLVAKHFLPLLRKDQPSVFAALSARVGSISDNRLGGWYGDRASKAALNQVIKTLAVELARTHPHAVCVALHPGTVARDLSQPFQGGVPADNSPITAAEHLLNIIVYLTATASGRVFALNGIEIDPWTRLKSGLRPHFGISVTQVSPLKRTFDFGRVQHRSPDATNARGAALPAAFDQRDSPVMYCGDDSDVLALQGENPQRGANINQLPRITHRILDGSR